MAEQGAADAEVRSMLPRYGQRALPDAILARVSKAMLAAQADPETKQRLAAAYIEPMSLSPGETEATLKAEHERLGQADPAAGHQGRRRLTLAKRVA